MQVLVGKTIVAVREMTQEELEHEGWSNRLLVPVLVLSDGTKLYCSRDEEGNGPGALFGMTLDGESFAVTLRRYA